MRIRILSDVHLEFAHFRPPPAPADVVVLAGDIHVGVQGVLWAQETFPDMPVVYVPGNHEYYGSAIPGMLQELRRAAAGSNVHVLDREALEIGGVRFLGCTLWTDLALVDGDSALGAAAAGATMADYRLIRVSPLYRKLKPKDTIAFHQRSLRWLEDELASGGPVVVVSHHAPARTSLDPYYTGDPSNAAFASDLRAFIQRTAPQLWIHGHIHRAADYRIDSTRVVCNPRGYPAEPAPGFRPDLVVAVSDQAQKRSA